MSHDFGAELQEVGFAEVALGVIRGRAQPLQIVDAIVTAARSRFDVIKLRRAIKTPAGEGAPTSLPLPKSGKLLVRRAVIAAQLHSLVPKEATADVLSHLRRSRFTICGVIGSRIGTRRIDIFGTMTRHALALPAPILIGVLARPLCLISALARAALAYAIAALVDAKF